jgi:hypothetical protein
MRGLAFTLLLMSSTLSHAAACTVRSGPQTAALVELYTSEGCSSCPPADRWLSQVKASPSLVPIAFHVAYWDYLGWKDVFGDARFTERQRQFARLAGARSVYTPQVVLAGRDFPDWRSGGAPRALEAVNARPAKARLEITTSSGGSASVKASLAPGVRTDEFAVFVALTENGLVTQVRAGENRGETLRHDHVARDLKVARGWSTSGELAAAFEFVSRPAAKPESLRVVAFVQSLRTGEVIQALSAPPCLGV